MSNILRLKNKKKVSIDLNKNILNFSTSIKTNYKGNQEKMDKLEKRYLKSI